ncbi:MAG: GIY-YIG nuclease family protein [Thermoproteota archaeon]
MKGSYMLIILIERSIRLKPGSLPETKLPPGCYVYVGSAMGLGGFEKRVVRHLRKIKKVRWHIDYLTILSEAKVRSVFYTPHCSEHHLVSFLSSLGFQKTVRGFGATDFPRDFSHLLHSNQGFEKTVSRIRLEMRRRGVAFRLLDEEALRNLCG